MGVPVVAVVQHEGAEELVQVQGVPHGQNVLQGVGRHPAGATAADAGGLVQVGLGQPSREVQVAVHARRAAVPADLRAVAAVGDAGVHADGHLLDHLGHTPTGRLGLGEVKRGGAVATDGQPAGADPEVRVRDRQRQPFQLELRLVVAAFGQAVHVHHGLAEVGHGLVLQDQLGHAVKPAERVGGGKVAPGTHAEAGGADDQLVQQHPLLLAERGGVEHGAVDTARLQISDASLLVHRHVPAQLVVVHLAAGVDRDARHAVVVQIGAEQTRVVAAAGDHAGHGAGSLAIEDEVLRKHLGSSPFSSDSWEEYREGRLHHPFP